MNSTIACALVASKLNIKVAHVEAGLRSFDRTMPEEINRVLTDHMSDFLFVTEKSGIENLANEGITKNKVHLVGNCMIDTLINSLESSEKSTILEENKITSKNYSLVTFHRPSNVDNLDKLKNIVNFINKISQEIPAIFPIHPRTNKQIKKFNLTLDKNVLLLDPLPYLDFIKLLNHSKIVITDSGGIQEESTFLGVQCITCRDNTERPITTDIGTNQLVGSNVAKIKTDLQRLLKYKNKQSSIPLLWDGLAAKRIVEILRDFI